MRPNYDVKRLNALTRYPTVPSYHVPDAQGRPTLQVKVSFAHEPQLIISEKIAGHSIRVILTKDGYFLGNKTEILAWHEEIDEQPMHPILNGMRMTANHIFQSYSPKDEGIKVFFGVFFGGSSHPHAKQYTGGDYQLNSFKLSDGFSLPANEFTTLYNSTAEQIGEWRESNQQPFYTETSLLGFGIPVNPRLRSSAPPVHVAATLAWMQHTLPKSKACLSYLAPGKPNGILIRTPNRSKIAKLSFAEYEKFLK